MPKRNTVPLAVDEVARFWSSFRTARDLAIVGLMLVQGLRFGEVLGLNEDDVLLSEAQLLTYRRLERPHPRTTALFVSLKGPARGARMTLADYVPCSATIASALASDSPTRIGSRRTFASDMVIPALSPRRSPKVNFLDQLRSEPTSSAGCPACARKRRLSLPSLYHINLIVALGSVFTELAWTEQLSQLVHLIRRPDIPLRARRVGDHFQNRST